MNKTLIALATSLALVSVAQADSKFYGKMNVATTYEDESEEFKVESNASRLGVKGSEELSTSKIIYQAEYQIDVDGDDSSVLKQRNTYIGLAYNSMGTIKMGMMDTPLKTSQGKFDLFNDVVDIKNVLAGENRMANTVNYTTEKMGNVQSSVSVILPENDSSEGISASVVYKAGNIYASAAFDNKVKGEATQRMTVIYNLGDIKVGALLNNVDAADTAGTAGEELGFAVNASMKMGMNTLKAQFDSGEQKKSGASSLSLGLDHKLAKATKAYFVFSQFSADANTDGTSNDTTTLAMGLEHKF
jgi:predicted porin